MKQVMEVIMIDGYEVIYMLDEDNDLHIVTLRSSGGPIVSAATREEAYQKFREGMALGESIRKLLHFQKHSKYPDK